jgi:hypothetical protein
LRSYEAKARTINEVTNSGMTKEYLKKLHVLRCKTSKDDGESKEEELAPKDKDNKWQKERCRLRLKASPHRSTRDRTAVAANLAVVVLLCYCLNESWRLQN